MDARARCGCDVVAGGERKYIRLLKVEAHTKILSTSSKTILTQTFENPYSNTSLQELRYVFPLFEGVSVVGFTAYIGSQVVHGVVKEKSTASQAYKEAKDRGEVAGLLEQSLRAGDAFVTTIGNVPPGESIAVKIEYLAELQHDAETDAIRFTIPTSIAPRYGPYDLLQSGDVSRSDESFSVTVDAEMPQGSAIQTVQSPSHLINVQIGRLSTCAAQTEPSLSRASASLSLGTSELAADFIVQIGASKLGEPSAMLETHPETPNHCALMTTLVPKFNLPAERPEIVFVCDRSGSMGTSKIVKLKAALNVFLKSLPLGVKFNLVSFGSRYELLWDRSQTYDQSSLDQAVAYVESFSSNFGGTEMYEPLAEVFKKRYTDMNLEVFLLTDGEIWRQDALFGLINEQVAASKGAVRLFTVGIGRTASHSLIHGAARAGNGFAQSVGDDEQATTKFIRMLKASLLPHITDYSLELNYPSMSSGTREEDFEVIEELDATQGPQNADQEGQRPNLPISLYDPATFEENLESGSTVVDAAEKPEDKYAHLPNIATPRCIQSPHIIPPLFPFNRTTAYVLLSDAHPDHLPHSLLLKGTTAHGPVELEIPITILADKGTTLHQLAARNTVRELEEGRGWIFHAHNTASEKLLKDEYDGKFADMVEREAVKLGVKHQITGKWTSFVAVEDDEKVGEPPSEMDVVNRTADVRSRSAFAKTRAGAGPRSGGFACKAPKKKKATTDDYHSNRPSGGRSGGLGNSRCHDGPKPHKASMMARVEPAQDGAQNADESDSDENQGFALIDDAPAPALRAATQPSPPKPAPSPSIPPLQRLINLQRFDGRWVWTKELVDILNLDERRVSAAARDAGTHVQTADVLATVAAILYLQSKLADEQSAWDMVVSKAETWVESAQGVDGYQDARQALKNLFQA